MKPFTPFITSVLILTTLFLGVPPVAHATKERNSNQQNINTLQRYPEIGRDGSRVRGVGGRRLTLADELSWLKNVHRGYYGRGAYGSYGSGAFRVITALSVVALTSYTIAPSITLASLDLTRTKVYRFRSNLRNLLLAFVIFQLMFGFHGFIVPSNVYTSETYTDDDDDIGNTRAYYQGGGAYGGSYGSGEGMQIRFLRMALTMMVVSSLIIPAAADLNMSEAQIYSLENTLVMRMLIFGMVYGYMNYVRWRDAQLDVTNR